MKRYFLFLLAFSFAFVCFSQNGQQGRVKPLFNYKVVRNCNIFAIDGVAYNNVTVTIRSKNPGLFRDHYRVIVTVKNRENKTLYKKTFNDNFLYLFSSGQIQVGNPEFCCALIWWSGGYWSGELDELNGIGYRDRNLSAPGEKAHPVYGVNIAMTVDSAAINEKLYGMLQIKIDAPKREDGGYEGVTLSIKDHKEDLIYEKRFTGAYLYSFSDGSLCIGKGNDFYVGIAHKEDRKGFLMVVNDKP